MTDCHEARGISTIGPSWAVRFRASGLFVFALFGAIWAITAASYLGDPLAMVVRLTGIACSGLLAIVATALVRRSRRLPRNDGPTEQSREKRFYVLTVVEVIALFSAYAALRAIGQHVMIAPVSELIVGLHFLRLAGLLEVRSYRASGAGLCLTVAVGTLLAVAVPNSTAPVPMVAVMSMAAAVILWGTGFVGAWQIQRMTAGSDASPQPRRLSALKRVAPDP